MHNTRLKLWTLLAHAFIIVGFGHGLACLLVIEVLTFPYFNHHEMSFYFSGEFESHLPVVGLFTLLGQLLMITSIIFKKKVGKTVTLIASLVFLWFAIVYFNLDKTDHNHGMLMLSVAPFAILNISIFLKPNIGAIRQWIIDHLA